jgi:Helix-turn-helix domain
MPAQLDSPEALRAAGVDGTGRLSQVSARSHIHEAKKAIVAQMRELDRPVTSKELYARLDRAWSLKAIEYHLDTLRKAGIVEVVIGPELRFSLVGGGGGPRELGRGAAGACGSKPMRPGSGFGRD